MAKLKVVQGGEVGREYIVRPGESIMGRSPECDIVLDVAAVSRHHATVVHHDNRYYIRDSGSRNGTFVNGERVAGQRELQHGDYLTICDIQFLFESAPPAAPVLARAMGGPTLLGPVAAADEEGGSTIMAMIDVAPGLSSSFHFSAKPETQLQAMIEISNSLGRALSVDEILPKLLDSLFKIFVQADRGFVIMRPKPEAPLVPVAAKARRGDDDQEMRFSRTIVQRAMEERQAILTADAATDARFNMAQSISDIQIRSLICAPMVTVDGRALGVIQIDTSDQRSRFTDQDLQVLAGVANQAAIAMDNARMHEEAERRRALERDLDLARQMQQSLLPSAAPSTEGYHFFQYYQSAYQVGGDYYDYVMLPNERFAAVVGDVAGKGVSAAIIMAKLSSDVRFWLAREQDPVCAMREINAAFCRYGWDDRFVTMVIAIVDPRENLLTLVNAGHMPPLLRSSTGQVQEIGGDQAGLPIGVIDDFQFEAFRRSLDPGDLVTIFTDGFSEAMNAKLEQFGLERLAEIVGDPQLGADAVGPHILQQVRQFAGDFPQSDDMCLVCLGRQ